ncbi:NAD-dependent epimerase/dehydratase family protein [Actinomycetospora aeridis]|uniref:NAD-dependent epimerase/dehydratase family protein n=1 Tax=Actinomycetospora aeridis TaxID=3129231 RepID=A0ABU8N7I5_9PSEU
MSDPSRPVLVTGAGGFIGGHLVRSLVAEGRAVRAADTKPFEEWFQHVDGVDERRLDLTRREACENAVDGVGDVYNLAADMGGMGFIENNRALCMLSVLINTHMLQAACDARVDRYFYASSACVYAADKQVSADVLPLVETDAYPAMPEDGYGWEKLFSERMCRHFAEDFGMVTRVARYHNVYGPNGTFEGGREKAPAAICRKVAEAALHGDDEIEIWGDGHQTRSFMYVDDCVRGTRMILDGASGTPVNLGSAEMVSINQLVDIVEDIAGVRLKRTHRLDAPQGVRGRSSDNTQIQETYGWEPSTTLRDGLERTYSWIVEELQARRVPA